MAVCAAMSLKSIAGLHTLGFLKRDPPLEKLPLNFCTTALTLHSLYSDYDTFSVSLFLTIPPLPLIISTCTPVLTTAASLLPHSTLASNPRAPPAAAPLPTAPSCPLNLGVSYPCSFYSPVTSTWTPYYSTRLHRQSSIFDLTRS